MAGDRAAGGVVVDYLRTIERDTTAAEISHALAMTREDTYLALVQAEARGLARTCSNWHAGRRVMLWGAMSHGT